MKEQFYPFWYKNKIILENKRQFRKILLLLILYMILGMINIYSITMEIKEHKIESHIQLEEAINKESQGFQVVHRFNHIIELLDCGEDSIKALELTGEETYLELYIKDMKEYEEVVRSIEESFIIDDISPIKNEGEVRYFYVRMKNNDF